MTTKLRWWWQKIKQHRLAIGIVTIAFMGAITLIILGYQFDGIGFNGYNIITTSKATNGVTPPTITRIVMSQPGKTLWDWMQLLFVPSVLTLGAVWISSRQNHDLQIAERQRVAEHELAVDKYREEALVTYFDKMSDLLLKRLV